jgi:hypothetical protein
VIFVSYVRRGILFAILFAIAAPFMALPFIDYILPFDLDRAPNILTRLHLQFLEHAPERCYAALDRANISYRREPALNGEKGCGYENAVWLERSGASYGGRVLLRCPAMLGLLLWERHVLAPAAERTFDRKLLSVRHLGTYSCRNVRDTRRGSLSQHAFANAIDVAGFFVEGQPAINVRDWKDGGVKGRFLREARDGACGIFGVVLSPDYDGAHANHFHLDMNWLHVCR